MWRIQNSEGFGPYYRANAYVWAKTDDCHQGPDHPGPNDDFTADVVRLLDSDEGRELRFGFETLEQLNNWFTVEELDALAALGFTQTLIEAEKVYVGSKQVLFLPVKY